MRYTYQVHRPLTASFFKEKDGNRFSMFYTVTPIDAGESRAWGILAINYAPKMTMASMTQFSKMLLRGSDIPVVESQRPELLPLDLQVELHLRSDRTAIAYRQWLHKIGLRHGTV